MPATRRLYDALALTLGEHDADPALVDEVAADLANDNPRFDVGRFVEAVDSHRPNA